MNKLLLITLYVLFTTPILSLQFDKNRTHKTRKMKITIENKEFTVSLNDSEAAKELLQMLPMTVTMGEHNGNEKYYNLPKSFSGRTINSGKVLAGELMIWASSTLVLFYTEASTSYSYIRLGQVDDILGLSESLGRGNVKVKFERQAEEKNRL